METDIDADNNPLFNLHKSPIPVTSCTNLKIPAVQKVRIAALECLEELTALPSHVLVPHQPRVVRELKRTLDDKKRLVRRQAAQTRSAW